MLIYHPAYDASHGMFRMLRLVSTNPSQEMRWDTFRILDIYYLFPQLLSAARLPQKLTKAKKAAAAGSSKYNHAPSPKTFIQQMLGLHESVAISLVAKRYFDDDAFKKQRILRRTETELPPNIQAAFVGAGADSDLVRLLAIDMATIPLSGRNGLKERTGLLENYYDPI